MPDSIAIESLWRWPRIFCFIFAPFFWILRESSSDVSCFSCVVQIFIIRIAARGSDAAVRASDGVAGRSLEAGRTDCCWCRCFRLLRHRCPRNVAAVGSARRGPTPTRPRWKCETNGRGSVAAEADAAEVKASTWQWNTRDKSFRSKMWWKHCMNEIGRIHNMQQSQNPKMNLLPRLSRTSPSSTTTLRTFKNRQTLPWATKLSEQVVQQSTAVGF